MSGDPASATGVRTRAREKLAVPAARREQTGSGFVLEQPPGKVPSRPRREPRDPDSAARAPLPAQYPTEEQRHAVVGKERTGHGPPVRRRDGLRSGRGSDGFPGPPAPAQAP